VSKEVITHFQPWAAELVNMSLSEFKEDVQAAV